MTKAINPKYQAKVNRVVYWNDKYDTEVNNEDNMTTDRDILKSQKLQEKYYNKLAEIIDTLPKREQSNLAKHMMIYL